MRKFLIFGLLLSLTALVKAQQQTTYTQYNLNRFALNPALAGIQPCGELITGSRRQWVGFEGAPETYFATFNTRINKEDKYPKNFHGYGVQMVSDQYGFSNNSIFKAAYAYNMKTSNNFRASFGLYLGIQRFSQNYSNIRIANKGLDPALDPDKEISLVLPEISPGIFIYNKNLYAGLSMIQAFPARIKTLGTSENRMSAHYFLLTGYRLRGRQIDYVPSILTSFSPLVSPTVDLSLTFDYKQRISLGLGSKYLNSGYAVIQLQVLSYLGIGYAYEYAFNEINTVAPTTHEFVLQIKNCTDVKRKGKILCPAYQ